jgi:hypothetical protein
MNCGRKLLLQLTEVKHLAIFDIFGRPGFSIAHDIYTLFLMIAILNPADPPKAKR